MDAESYVTEILTNRLLSFVQQTFPDGSWFQQDTPAIEPNLSWNKTTSTGGLHLPNLQT